ncbi:MAG: hypothetical protein N2515_03485 [Deltaproteobacteria bacterium]|nr:hypothetical protein [Deltaproteobacteria bacterium]
MGHVEAVRVLGDSEVRILFRHMLPNVLGSALVLGRGLGAHLVLIESALHFLRLGATPPYASLGILVHDGKDALGIAPHALAFPLTLATSFAFQIAWRGLAGCTGCPKP